MGGAVRYYDFIVTRGSFGGFAATVGFDRTISTPAGRAATKLDVSSGCGRLASGWPWEFVFGAREGFVWLSIFTLTFV